MNPLVSICIPTYNRARFIERAIKSTIDQTYKNIEIIVVDNASTDNTDSIISKFPSIRYFKNQKNVGSGLNFLKCLEYAKGEYVQLLGSDDWLSENYIEECLKAMRPDVASIMGNIVTLNESLSLVDKDSLEEGEYTKKW